MCVASRIYIYIYDFFRKFLYPGLSKNTSFAFLFADPSRTFAICSFLIRLETGRFPSFGNHIIFTRNRSQFLRP